MPIPPDQKAYWSDALELKLRRLHGDAFQNFFADMMEFRHPEDFVRVKASGPLGDKKCDGYLQSSVSVYQCYGAENGGAKKESVNATLVAKIVADYMGACSHWADMTVWYMVHNFVDGVGATAVEKLAELQRLNPQQQLRFFGKQRFAQEIFALEPHEVEVLLGKIARHEDFLNIQAPEVVALMGGLMKAASDDLPIDFTIKAVPVDKLQFNNLSGAFLRKVALGRPNATIVETLLHEHPNPLFATTIANEFRRRYLNLYHQGLEANSVMNELYCSIVGYGNVPAEKDVAAWSLLAYLFDQCTIFRDAPATAVMPELEDA